MKIYFLRNNFPKIVIPLLLMPSLIIISGCESIPPGTPPEGPIVSINTTDEKALTTKNAVNDMTTAIATCSVLYEYGDIPTVSLKGEEIPEELKDVSKNLGYLTSHLFRNLVEMNMIKLPMSFDNDKVNFIIHSTFSKNFDNINNWENSDYEIVTWDLELLSPGKSHPLWKQKVKVKIKRKIKEKEESII